MQLLVAAMNTEPLKLAEEMQLDSDAIIVNQTDHYAYEELEPISADTETNSSALRQIIRNYKDLFFWLFDPVWEWTFDILMDLNDDNENEVYQKYDINQLQQAVRERQLLPACFYENM
jgi:hypothetical protein